MHFLTQPPSSRCSSTVSPLLWSREGHPPCSQAIPTVHTLLWPCLRELPVDSPEIVELRPELANKPAGENPWGRASLLTCDSCWSELSLQTATFTGRNGASAPVDGARRPHPATREERSRPGPQPGARFQPRTSSEPTPGPPSPARASRSPCRHLTSGIRNEAPRTKVWTPKRQAGGQVPQRGGPGANKTDAPGRLPRPASGRRGQPLFPR